MTPPARQDVVAWITNAWGLLSQRTIKAGFIKARISPRDTSSMSLQRLLLPCAVLPPESDWNLLVYQLRQNSVPADGINAALDIDDDDGSSSSIAVADDDPGCVGDDEGGETGLDEAP
ncbi:hypothetical protein PF005_g21913 [Phytophthora fragariae]|uniref:Uncharacterized protein n=1 Tax=Phytophthora fragariae TaxID=53985 RepID=A0A6A3RX09_9STRA|nr:hypothetical protein PF003_g34876 [Phytophthora fragariae]KAE8931301.1 hypothetical protein PF009_g18645 [Phytophthora fragariae]KAE8983151.1 hypothetical protein PF011_g21316 [Phytophthora fragariae]KAE9081262.1 hypothetical protein PF010_g22061 [Phytophthora fragariae]KAE9081447.1 hypothetical protein PF007_g22657 [Phytophthora fragariae]